MLEPEPVLEPELLLPEPELELLPELLWLVLPEGATPLKLGSLWPVAGPVETYSLLL